MTEEPAHLICTVQDEGPGLSVEEQHRLFQRGVRLSPVPTGGEPSSGYGLAVAKEIIEKLMGTSGVKADLARALRFPSACRCTQRNSTVRLQRNGAASTPCTLCRLSRWLEWMHHRSGRHRSAWEPSVQHARDRL